MKNYEIRSYEYNPGDRRDEIIVHEGAVTIVHTTENGSGLYTRRLFAGESWREGREELMGIYATDEEAELAWNGLL